MNIESIINVLDYLGKLDRTHKLKSVPIDVMKYMLKDIESPKSIKSFCLADKLYMNYICNDDNFWKEKYIKRYGDEGITYLTSNNIKTYSELYELNYNYHQLSIKLKFFKDFDFWYNVEELFMRNRKLKEVPEEIFLLTKLKTLSLAQNKLIEVPKDISKLTNLQILSLSKNNLISLPEEIGELKSLKVLNLIDNKLISLPDSLTKLYNLEFLHIEYNPNLYISENLKDLPNLIYVPETSSSYGYYEYKSSHRYEGFENKSYDKDYGDNENYEGYDEDYGDNENYEDYEDYGDNEDYDINK